MYFDSVSALLSMDGHGSFVWSAYAITLVVILHLLITPLRRRARLLRELAGELRRAKAAPSGSAPSSQEETNASSS